MAATTDATGCATVGRARATRSTWVPSPLGACKDATAPRADFRDSWDEFRSRKREFKIRNRPEARLKGP